MTRYTARNGTTFLYEPSPELSLEASVQVMGADDEGPGLTVDLSDLFEFVQFIEAGVDPQAPTDADVSAVGPD